MRVVLGILLLLTETVYGQYHIILSISDEDSHEPIAGASVEIKLLKKGGISDSAGIAFLNNIPRGNYECKIACEGYADEEIKLNIPSTKDTLFITLERDEEMLSNVVVSSSRTNSRIKDLPTRVEVLGTEDMEEETSMHPGNASMLLSEASGIQTQQTSASSGNVQIRILGLDGKYTQLLKDGFPMYSSFSNGLSIMQIPPLDLKQVELIKGSSSSLYGGDAIAGIINFISKDPSAIPTWNALINQTNRDGTDVGSFFTARNKHWGITLLNTFSHQVPVDIHNDGFTVLPRLTAYTINPKLFWYPSDSATLSLAINTTYDNRTGGDIMAVENGPSPTHPYTEKNKSYRDYYQLKYERHLAGNRLLTVRNSTSVFNRDIGIANYTFSGKQTSTFSEISYLFNWAKHKTVGGVNFTTDQFNENRHTDSLIRDYHFVTTGIFIQDDWMTGEHWVLETGIRNDYQNRFGNFLLPRASLLYKLSKSLSLRVGGGLGYKPATIFDAQTEETGYKNVLPVGNNVEAERSAGGNFNINYSGTLGEDTRFILDHSFYYTQVNNPLQLDSSSGNQSGQTLYYFSNAKNPYSTRGFETSVRLKQGRWSVFAGYTYVDARTGVASYPYIPLVPRSKVVFDLSNEKENNYRIALEAFYTGSQYLYDGTKTPDYWVTGLLLEKEIKRFILVLNFEDLTDARQTRFGPVVILPITNPMFREIYAPLEGFMANIAVKVKIL